MSTPRLDQGEVIAVAGRRERFAWTLRLVNSSGQRAGMGASDVVRFKLASTENATAPTLDFTSSAPASGGSLITITTRGSSSEDATGIVELRRGDTSGLSGVYYFEIDVDDAADANRTSQPMRGKMLFRPSMGGNIGA